MWIAHPPLPRTLTAPNANPKSSYVVSSASANYHNVHTHTHTQPFTQPVPECVINFEEISEKTPTMCINMIIMQVLNELDSESSSKQYGFDRHAIDRRGRRCAICWCNMLDVREKVSGWNGETDSSRLSFASKQHIQRYGAIWRIVAACAFEWKSF